MKTKTAAELDAMTDEQLRIYHRKENQRALLESLRSRPTTKALAEAFGLPIDDAAKAVDALYDTRNGAVGARYETKGLRLAHRAKLVKFDSGYGEIKLTRAGWDWMHRVEADDKKARSGSLRRRSSRRSRSLRKSRGSRRGQRRSR